MKLLTVILLSAIGLGCGYSKPATTPPQAGTKPVIAQLVPSSAGNGGPAFTFEVDGNNFSGKAVINFGGAAQATTFVSATKLTTMIPGSAIMNKGTVQVTVTNPGTPGGIYGGGTSPAISAPPPCTVN